MSVTDMPILHSILDSDFYKITMQNGVLRLFPKAKARYQFVNRGKHTFPQGFAEALREAVDEMNNLRLTLEEKEFLRANCPYLDPGYLDFLQGYCYNSEEVFISQQGEQLFVAVEGYWYRTILWEVPLLALISELYYVFFKTERMSDDEIVEYNKEKIGKYRGLGVILADFGTRRRHSYHVHRLVVKALADFGKGIFIGSSNVHLAMENQVKPIGTHAHEWIMFHSARYGFKMANTMSLQHWVDVYRGDLGIALSDTYTTPVFFKAFDRMFSKLFDGVRHDSGDPIAFADYTIKHYQSLGIDPLTKTIIFSDSLNYEKVARIAEHCRGKIGMSFGIGTSLTNDVGPRSMNI
ncbi:MAG TPA: nicotinate phosphoribosyltransferase, partial [Cytophagales bacterium]|nr:nicotinate phosphoribosyltransferase [Cytophagales bacterium]